MDPYNPSYFTDSSRNHTRQQTPFTNHYVYDDMSENLRVSSPFSHDFYQQNPTENVTHLKKQLNQEIKRYNVLQQQVSNLQYQNDQLRRNQYNNISSQQTNSLKQQNQRLREEIERKKLLQNVPQNLIDQLAELKRENGWLRQNVMNLSQKNYQRY